MGALGRLKSSGLGLARLGCLLAGLLLAPRVAHAQSTAESLLDAAPAADHLRARVTMDPAFMFGLGYVRTVPLAPKGTRQLGVHVDLEALLDFSSWDLTAGVSTRLFDRPGFDVLGVLDLDLGLGQNEVHTALTYGYRLTLAPGYYGRKWYAAAELGLRGNLAASIWHKDDYLAEAPGAQDGTFVTGAAYLYLGAGAGFRFFQHYFAGLRAAYRMPTTFESYGPWVQPMTLGVELGGTVDLF